MDQPPQSAQAITNPYYNPYLQKKKSQQQLAELYIDNDSICFNFALLITLISISIFLVLISIATPKAFMVFKPNDIICSNPVFRSSDNSIQCLPFDVYNNPNFATYVSNLSSLHQFMQVYVFFYTQNSYYGVNIDDEMTLAMFSIQNKNQIYYADDQLGVITFDIEIDTFSDQFKQNKQVKGYYKQIAYFHQISSSDILFISSIPSLTQSVNINNVTLQIVTANPQASRLYYVIRVVFFCISVLTFASYAIRLSLMDKNKRVLEQKFIMVLSFTLIFFNDPFFYITLTRPNNASSFFSSMFFLIFPVVLLFFFMCSFERADVQSNTKNSIVMKSPFKWILIIVTFAILSGFYLYQSIKYAGRQNSIKTVSYKSLKWFSVMMVILCYAISFYHCMQFYFLYETKRQRYKTLINISMFCFVFSCIAFVSSSFYVFKNSPAITFMIFTLFNLYIYVLQYLYSPTRNEIRKKYPGKVSNLQMAHRTAGLIINNNYERSDQLQNSNQKYHSMHNQIMRDDIRASGKWNSAMQSNTYPQQKIKQTQSNSVPDFNNIHYDRVKRQQKQQQEVNYEIKPSNDINVDNYQIDESQKVEEILNIEDQQYFFDQNNQHQKQLESDHEQDNQQDVPKQSKLISLSQSAIIPDHSSVFTYPINVTQSQIVRTSIQRNPPSFTSNILDDIYQGQYLEQQPQNQQRMKNQQDFFLEEPHQQIHILNQNQQKQHHSEQQMQKQEQQQEKQQKSQQNHQQNINLQQQQNSQSNQKSL